MRKLNIIRVAAVAATLAMVTAACGGSSSSTDTANAAGESLPTKIVIGYQNIPNGDLIVKHDGLLEAAFGDKVSIEWKLFDSGGSVNEAILAAWQQGDIDAAYVWNPVLAKLAADGGTVLITSEDLSKKGKTTYDLAVVTNSFASKYPAAVQVWLDQQNAAVKKIRNDAAGAAKAIAAELSITETEAADQLSQLIFLDASEQIGADYLGGGLAKNLYAAALFNKTLGKIDAVKEESAYQGAIISTFTKAAK